jgi:aminopeptidase N
MVRSAFISVALVCASSISPALAAPGARWPDQSPRCKLLGDERLVNPRNPVANVRMRSEPGNAVLGSFDGCPHSWDALHYDLAFTTVDIDTRIVVGTTTVTLASLTDDLASIDLDLKAPLVVTSVTQGVTPVAFSHVGDVLTVFFASPPDSADTVSVAVEYGGVPYNEGQGGFGGFWFQLAPTNAYSMGVALEDDPPSMGRAWYPCYDRPCDKATVSLEATVDLDQVVVSNGVLGSVDSTATQHTWHWSHDFPISTYLIAISVAPYRVLSDTVVTDPRIRIYHHPGYRVAATTSFQNVDAMMAGFEARFGPYPFEQFRFMTTLKGDMEHQTCVSHWLPLVNGTNAYDPILAHELAHQWFGDCVTYGDWRDVWLSEGFATYGEAVFREHFAGTAAYHSYVTGSILNPVLASSDVEGVYDPAFKWGTIAYEKGASVLHMLRGILDDDVLFWQVLQDYLTNFGYANAVTPNFIASAEATVGEDLSWFFDPFVYGEGHPVYEYGWSWDDLGGGQWEVDVVIRQVQTTASLFDLPVDFRVQTTSGSFDFSARIDLAEETVSFVVPAQPTGLSIDPGDWLLDEQLLAPTSADWNAEAAAVQSFALHAPAPSPFRDRTEIRYYLPAAGRTTTAIHDVAGRRVRALDERVEQAGGKSIWWDRRDDAGSRVAAGVYWVRLTTATGSLARKVVVAD